MKTEKVNRDDLMKVTVAVMKARQWIHYQSLHFSDALNALEEAQDILTKKYNLVKPLKEKKKRAQR